MNFFWRLVVFIVITISLVVYPDFIGNINDNLIPIDSENESELPSLKSAQGNNKKIKPNIIFIVADDAGWNDFSFHGSPQIPTPNIDALSLSGVILNNYYASPLCTPSRGALFTGKHPIHIRLQHYVIMGGSEEGLPLKEKLLPQYLKEFGYSTHLVGKWHLGHSRKEYTPTYRGFDSHFGYWLGAQDYYGHMSTDGNNFGYDFRSNLTVNYDVFGKYDTDLFTTEAIRIIENHAKVYNQLTTTANPLYLQINHIAPHSSNSYLTQQAPKENVDKFKDKIQNIHRRIYAGIVDKLDESFGFVIQALEKNQMLHNSIIIFSSDNGGAPEGFDNNYGSNYPLRGVKNTLWEGGIRVSSFVWSPVLVNNKANRVSKNLMHIQDWLPTIIEAIGEDQSELPEDIDGISQWKAILGEVETIRTELLHNIDDKYNNSAIRVDNWKVIQGNSSVRDLPCGNVPWDHWYGPSGITQNLTVHDLIPDIINSNVGKALTVDPKLNFTFNVTHMKLLQDEAQVICQQPPPPGIAYTSCDSYNAPCLFDIGQDPCEYNNLADKYPAILNSLLESIQNYNLTAKKPIPRYFDKRSQPKKWNYIWTNWKDYL